MKQKKIQKTQLTMAIELLGSGESVSTLEFRERGIMNPARVIERLKQRGAVVTTRRENQTDSMGRVHSRVAVYRLEGWTND
ncbi:helix-turn-helix domain-containing protein [Pseudidiomarina sp. CB1]|uniref:helix-turn-helix domain-containing protein n=1 Tax=Pseudidiomarina sp. CB1 TaxID=2972484 RepID=UPI00216346CB|nr:helix-turn-helix domain-containing protein [Pseudidiomarina sp. CB1]